MRPPTLFRQRASTLQKVLVVFVAASFFVYPVTPIFAQVSEVNESQGIGATESSQSASSSIETDLQRSEGGLSGKDGGSEQMLLSGGGEAPAGPAPGFLTSRSLPAHVDMHSGALLYSIPIDLPPGRGVQPSLSLEYNNQRTSDGIVGYGWEISIPYIAHLNRTGINALYTNPVYSSSLDGELVVNGAIVDGYRPRVGGIENHHYLFSTSTNTWTLYDKQGNAYIFGSTTDSVQSGTVSGVERAYKWMLSEIRDQNGNYAKFTYAKDEGQLYPLSITYSGHATLGDGPFSVTFATSTRSDIRTSYASGFEVKTRHRISGIDVKIEGATVASYALSYTVGHNGNRSLLTSVQKTGYPESGSSVTLPATTLSYATTSQQFYTVPSSTYAGNRGAEIFTDVNGNGLNDVALFYRAWDNVSFDGSVYLDIGLSGADHSVNWVTPPDDQVWALYSGGTYIPAENDVRFIDTNADGRADVISSALSRFYPSTTTVPSLSWAQAAYSGTIPSFSASGGTSGILGDVNGDGLPDYVQSHSGLSQKTYLGNGSAWDEGTWGTHPHNVDTEGSTSQLIDLNGDGLDDWIYSSGATTTVRLNTGTGWSATSTDWTIATSTLHKSGSNYYDRGIRFMDMNGDGLPDFTRMYDYQPGWDPTSDPHPEFTDASFIMLNTGNGWGTPTPIVGTTTVRYSYDQYQTLHYEVYERGNFIANGQMVQDVITNVTSPAGATQKITYTPSAQLNTNPHLPISLLVVTASTIEDAFTPVATTTYAYGGGRVHRGEDVRDRLFAGFAYSTTTDPAAMTVRYFHQNNGTTTGESVDHFSLMGKQYREDRLTLSGQLLERNDYQWDTKEQGLAQVALLASGITSEYSTSTGAVRSSAVEYRYATTTSDLIEKKEYGEVTRNSDATFTDVSGDTRTTQFEYATSTLTAIQPVDQQIPMMDVLLVGGGGGGGNAGGPTTGGGGGAGGMATSSIMLTSGSYVITVGNGGSGGSSRGGNGGSSSIGTTTSVLGGGGGGGGNSDENASGGNGGSGGGAGGFFVNKSGGSGTAGQGNGGGNNNTSNQCSGGGGGAGTSGSSASAIVSGGGGSGATSTITGISLVYAGGGGGGGYTWCTPGGGGSGGGANGGTYGNSGGSGSANTGGGGGGSGQDGSGGGNGGSGVVIIRFPRANITVSSSTGATRTEVGNDSVLKWTQSGVFEFSLTTLDATSSTPVISKPSKETLLDNGGIRVKETKFYYDNEAFDMITKGNLTRRDTWVASTTYAAEQFAYLPQGLIASTTDPLGNVTEYTYDPFSIHVATTTNALGHQSHAYYDYSLGKPKKTIDPNGLIVEMVYDGIDRPLTEKQSDPDSPSSLLDVRTFAYTDTIGSRAVTETSYLSSATSTVVYKYLDAFDRPIQTRKEAEESDQFAVQDFSYNNFGLVHKESLPYFSTGTARTSATTTSALFSTYTYDPLKRPINVATVVGNTQTAYGLWTATTTDALGNPKAFGYDAFKRLARVTEFATSTPYITEYTYDAMDNLATTTDANGNVRSFTYDGRGKRLTAQDLHAPADGTFGTWSYVYDIAGNLASSTDPKSQQIDYAYDALNRVTSENHAGTGGVEIEYAYDSCTYGIGRMCIATSTGTVTNYSYTVHGRPAAETKVIGGVSYTTSHEYDWLGNPTLITYPNGTEVRYGYGASGQLNTVEAKPNGESSYAPVVINIDYAPTGQTTLREYGNGVWSTYTYDANELYRLKRILTQAATTSQFSMMMGGGGESMMMESFLEEGGGATTSPLTLLRQYFNAIQVPEGLFATTTDTTEAETESEEPIQEEVAEEEPKPEDAPTQDEEVPVIVEDTATTTPEVVEQEIVALEETVATSTSPVIVAATTTAAQEEAPTEDVSVEEVTATSTQVAIEQASTTEITTATTTKPVLSRIQAALEGKNAQEKAEIKGREIADAHKQKKERFSRERYGIEIVSVEAIEGGVQAFVRAWQKDGTQIGFGKDGSVDIERFRIFNPPVLVPDEKGDIVQQWEGRDLETGEVKQYERRLREDPQEALLQVIEHNLSVMKNIYGPENIEVGKRGNTVSTFYPASGQNSPVDGYVTRNTASTCCNGYTTWSDIRNGSGTGASDTGNVLPFAGARGAPNGFQNMSRSLFGFDTSSIPESDAISAATFTVFASNDASGSFGQKAVLDHRSAPVSISALSSSDYDIGNWDGARQSDTEIGFGSWTTDNPQNFVLNATGTANINKDGLTWFGGRSDRDLDNSSFTISPHQSNDAEAYFSDQTGTTQDPKLVVEHSDDPLPTAIQDITFTYDAVGNILTIDEDANTDAQRSVMYTYDNLYRLLTASTTAASTTPFALSFDHNALGNLISSALGAYSYTGTNYANPHAPTTIGGNTLTYDSNGNLTSYLGTTYTWDYRNRLASVATTTTTLFTYDHTTARVQRMVGTATTTYPSRYWEVAGTSTAATSTSYIFAGDLLIASIEQKGTSTPVYTFNHTDHLNSTNVQTDDQGVIATLRDYYPYGAERISTGDTSRTYIGEHYDPSTSLSYLNARYYDGGRGQFLSQDPVFWQVGNTKIGKAMLTDPQSMNSYSYAGNNPIINKDPEGLWYKEFLTGQQSWSSFYGEVGEAANYLGQSSSGWNFAMNHPIATGGIVGVGSIPALYAGSSLSGAVTMATWPGVSSAFAAKNAFAAVVYASLVGGNTLQIPGIVNSFGNANLSNPSSFYSGVGSLAWHLGPNFAGEHVGAISDAFQFSSMLVQTLGSAASNLFSTSVQTRTSTVNSFNSAIGGTGSGGGSQPSSNSLWVTPSGAVVNWGGNLVSPPPSK